MIQRITLLILSILFIFVFSCSNTTNPQNSSLLPWEEAYGRFYTRDLTRAQEEIPFTIVVPPYLPNNLNNISPEITGPLREYQTENKVEIELLFSKNIGNKVFGIIKINETNYPLLPPDPAPNPQYKYMEISGHKIIAEEGKYAQGNGNIFYLNNNDIYFIIGVFNYPKEEALKVVDSLVNLSIK